MLFHDSIYLDHAKATPVRREVLDRMLPLLCCFAGCPGSTHGVSKRAESLVEDARRAILSRLGPQPGGLGFTESAAVANRLAIVDLALSRATEGRILTTRCEDESVHQACETLKSIGFSVEYLPLDSEGRVDLDELSGTFGPDVVLVTLSKVNRETGAVQPTKQLATLCAGQTLLHTDGSLGFLLEDSFTDWGAHAVTLSGSTIWGPQNSGALWLDATKAPSLEFAESKSLADIVGFTEAFCLLWDEKQDQRRYLRLLEEQWQARLATMLELLAFEVRTGEYAPGHFLLNLVGIAPTNVEKQLDHAGVCVSAFETGVRFSLGRTNTIDDLSAAITALRAACWVRRRSEECVA